MTYWTSHTVRNLPRYLQSLAAALLVLIYLAANVEFEAIHETFHQHEAHVTHTTADEQDPCHLAIYHHADEKGCHHRAHLSEGKKCPLCHISHVSDKIFVKASITDEVVVHKSTSIESIPLVFTQVVHHLPSRAPPSLA